MSDEKELAFFPSVTPLERMRAAVVGYHAAAQNLFDGDDDIMTFVETLDDDRSVTPASPQRECAVTAG